MGKFAVLGATGATGRQLLNLALEQGHEIVALCRNPSTLTVNHENLQAVQADVNSSESMKAHFTGCDVIFSCLGTSGALAVREITFYSETIKCITQAMEESGVKRLVCMSSWCTDFRGRYPGSFFMEWILKPFMGLTIGRLLSDMARMEQYLMQRSQDTTCINYTVVRPPGLSNGPVTDKEFFTEEGQYVTSVGYQSTYISRADVARFMLACLETQEYDKKIIAIAV
ncbi:uncharacterized sugar epimerase YhfK-like [Asterias rubens]|uniref:uncharacterized sugar epimerase YhfK-like n=1 Tax=Asterias rubens TaxID=7604 RepID=UPI00145506DC|nr:uncharacterized sugar epimerase YhfK-like [Asterias rubens]